MTNTEFPLRAQEFVPTLAGAGASSRAGVEMDLAWTCSRWDGASAGWCSPEAPHDDCRWTFVPALTFRTFKGSAYIPFLRTDYPVERIFSEWVPGSGQNWLNEEYFLLEAEPAYMERMANHLGVFGPWWVHQEHGWPMLGPDGRVWDGHHRMLAARRKGLVTLPVMVALEALDA